MRVYRGGVSVPVSISIYPREESPCPHVPRNESVVVYVCFFDFTSLRLHVCRLIMFACRKVTTNEMSKINATINITYMFETKNYRLYYIGKSQQSS